MFIPVQHCRSVSLVYVWLAAMFKYGQLTSTHGVKYSHQQDMQFVDLGLRSVMRCNCSNPVALSFHFLAALFIWHFTITVIFPGICL